MLRRMPATIPCSHNRASRQPGGRQDLTYGVPVPGGSSGMARLALAAGHPDDEKGTRAPADPDQECCVSHPGQADPELFSVAAGPPANMGREEGHGLSSKTVSSGPHSPPSGSPATGFRMPAAISARTAHRLGGYPPSASISPMQPQQSPPQSSESSSPGWFSLRPQMLHALPLMEMVAPVRGDVVLLRGRAGSAAA
jgi:hypothetical protein